MINPQQQAPPPQQAPTQPQAPPKRERKQITIRDPNQGGRDITKEIMSGGRSTTAATPPQVSHPFRKSTLCYRSIIKLLTPHREFSY
uniref:Eukaryotic translation initiation factor 4 gamma 1 n=1 Tax=Poecilia mexicana TaxID=48701 RepID=A0A3B3YK18_9TELE